MSVVQAHSRHLGNTKTSILPAETKPEWSLWPRSALVEQVMEYGSHWGWLGGNFRGGREIRLQQVEEWPGGEEARTVREMREQGPARDACRVSGQRLPCNPGAQGESAQQSTPLAVCASVPGPQLASVRDVEGKVVLYTDMLVEEESISPSGERPRWCGADEYIR